MFGTPPFIHLKLPDNTIVALVQDYAHFRHEWQQEVDEIVTLSGNKKRRFKGWRLTVEVHYENAPLVDHDGTPIEIWTVPCLLTEGFEYRKTTNGSWVPMWLEGDHQWYRVRDFMPERVEMEFVSKELLQNPQTYEGGWS